MEIRPYQNQIYFGWKKFFLNYNLGISKINHTKVIPPKLYNIKSMGFDKSNQKTYFFHRNLTTNLQWIQKGDILADCSASDKGELALGQNLLAAYMPWEGLNFEDAVLINNKILGKYTSLQIEKYDYDIEQKPFDSIIKIGSWVKEGDILVASQIKPINLDSNSKTNTKKTKKTRKTKTKTKEIRHKRLLYDIVGKDKDKQIQDQSFRVPNGVSGRVIKISICYQKVVKNFQIDTKKRKKDIKSKSLWLNLLQKLYNKRWPESNKKIVKKIKKHQNRAQIQILKIVLYIAKKNILQVGDKISGRHGNKGIISKILGSYDMPFLPNGECIDILLNPLGVPSRMNAGQIFECILGLSGKILQTHFQIACFDEMEGYETSRSLIYSKLLQAAQKTKQKWLFSKKTPAKVHLFDGRNGQLFDQSVLVGWAYIMKLIHIVDEKIHARSIGAYSLITQQPLRGRAKHGGQRVGEMEVWALQGFGCAYILQELLTVKSDDLLGRNRLMVTILKNTPLNFGTPESLRVVLRELQSLCIDISLVFR
jgi:DNA-directed RNA polymerase subunit beta